MSDIALYSRLMCRALEHRSDTPCMASTATLLHDGAEKIANLQRALSTARENLARLAAEGPTMSMTTDRTDIRNSADEMVLSFSKPQYFSKTISDKLDAAQGMLREYIRLFEESQEVARTAVAEVKRLRMFISEEFFMDAKKGTT